MKSTKLTLVLSVLIAATLLIGCKKDDPNHVVTFAAKSTSSAYSVKAKMTDGTEVKSGDRVPTGTELVFTYSPVPEKPHTPEWYVDGSDDAIATSPAYICKVSKNTKVELDVKMTAKPDEPCISFSVVNLPGEEIKITMIPNLKEDAASLWVDLNNNYIKDEGEDVLEISDWGVYFKGKLQEQRLSVFGKVGWFESNMTYTSIEASEHEYLTHFNVQKGNFEKFTIKNCPKLRSLDLSKNPQLTTIELTNLPGLWSFAADDCNISTVKLSGLSGTLTGFSLNNNNMSSEGITNLIKDLPKSDAQYGGTLKVMGNPGIVTEALFNAAKTKNWDIEPLPNRPVTGITLDPAEIKVPINDVGQNIVAIISPDDATNKNVIWSSSNKEVVNPGSYTGTSLMFWPTKAGTTTITATTQDGNFKATCQVTVEDKPIRVTGVKINPAGPITMTVGETKSFYSTVLPANATNKKVHWSYAHGGDKIYMVDNEDGTATVTALKAGEGGSIKVRTDDGSYTDLCNITVVSKATGVTLNHTELTIPVGESATLTATVQPTDVVDKSIIWTRENKTGYVAYTNTSQPSIELYGWKPGTATFWARANAGGSSASCDVKVTNPKIYGFFSNSLANNYSSYWSILLGSENPDHLHNMANKIGAAEFWVSPSSTWDVYLLAETQSGTTFHGMKHGGSAISASLFPATGFKDLAVDHTTNTMYGLYEGSELYTIDINKKTKTKVGTINAGVSFMSIAVDDKGQMYGINRSVGEKNCQVYKIDKSTAKAEVINSNFSTGVRATLGKLTFNHYDKTFYWAVNVYHNTGYRWQLRKLKELTYYGQSEQLTDTGAVKFDVIYIPYYPGY